MSVVLIKFSQKKDARFFLRQNTLQTNKKSSLYTINYFPLKLEPETKHKKSHAKNYYLLIALNTINANQLILTPGVEIITTTTPIEELLFTWAQSELNNAIKFIEYETTSKALDNTELINSKNGVTNYPGRIITMGEIEVIRLFAPLFDVMVIFNYTTNSFSDGGCYNTQEKLQQRIIEQVQSGATIIDIGVESTKPNVELLNFTKEISIWQEILPQVLMLKKEYDFLLSLDTYHNETVLWLLENFPDFDIINDVSGNIDVNIIQKLIQLNKKYIAMHNLGIPHNPNNIISLDQNPLDLINAFFAKKKQQFGAAGINETEIAANIIFDPGIGFGNNAAQAWYIIKNMDKFNPLGSELLLGHSRKSFMNHITTKPYQDRDLPTGFIALQAANFVDYVRIHDTILLSELQAVKAQI